MDTGTIFLISSGGGAVGATALAISRRRNPFVWFVLGAALGWIAIGILLIALPKSVPDVAAEPLEDVTGLPKRESLARMCAATKQRIRRTARTTAMWMFVGFTPVAVMILVFGIVNGDEDTLGLTCLTEFMAAVLPAAATYWLMARDAGAVEYVIQSGTVYPARAISTADVYGGSRHITVTWFQDGDTRSAFFDLGKPRPIPILRDLAVVVRGRYPMVVVVIGDDLYAARAPRQYHPFKRRRAA